MFWERLHAPLVRRKQNLSFAAILCFLVDYGDGLPGLISINLHLQVGLMSRDSLTKLNLTRVHHRVCGVYSAQPLCLLASMRVFQKSPQFDLFEQL